MSTIQDMNNRMKQNRAQRPSARAKFKENNRESIYSENKKSDGLSFKTIPKEALIALKKEINARAKKEKARNQFINGMLSIFLILLLFAVLYWLN